MFLKALILIGILNIFKCDTECPVVSTPSFDRRLDKNKLRLVQYNVEWLFVDYYSTSNCPGTGCTWVNETEALIHLKYVSDVIGSLNADIINICEIEGCDELNILNNNLGLTYEHYLKKGTDTSTGQNVGMITKIDPAINLYRSEDRYDYPISSSKCGYNGTGGNTGVSKHYITEFKINDIDIAMIGAHLLAIPTDPLRCSEREAQAMVLQKVIYDYSVKNYEIIMLGDFNDYDGEVLDINSHIPTSHVLEILKGNYGVYQGKYKLYNVAENIINQNERYSDWYDAYNNCVTVQDDFSMIDHVLVTEGLKEKVDNVFISHQYDEFCGKYNSDHYPVVVDFVF